jgi:hypothetical protein
MNIPIKKSSYSISKYLKNRINHPWRFHLDAARARCSHGSYFIKGRKCLLTKEQIKFLWFRDKAYKMKRPSIDRINGDGNYELTNCRFIELSENVRGNRGPRSILSKKIFYIIQNFDSEFTTRDVRNMLDNKIEKNNVINVIWRLKNSYFISVVNKPKSNRNYIYKYNKKTVQ